MEHKAWVVEQPGGDFRQAELPRPQPEMHQVLVRISASGVNPLDTKIRAGKAAHARQPLPAVLGLDMAGTVEETGPGVTSFKIGDEVYGMVGGVGGLQGTLATFGLYLPTTLADLEADRAAGYHTIAVRFGARTTYRIGYGAWIAAACMPCIAIALFSRSAGSGTSARRFASA